MNYAGIGSRDLTPEQIEVCEKLGSWFAQCGHTLHTGNALGADQAFARGANQVNPELVHLWLPWGSYESGAVQPGNVRHVLGEYSPDMLAALEVEVREFHPAWHRLKQGGRKLMMRNGLIISPASKPSKKQVAMRKPVDLVIAFPNPNKPGGGGTGHGLRLASKKYGIPIVDLTKENRGALESLCDWAARRPHGWTS